jgi:hypothetical protein
MPRLTITLSDEEHQALKLLTLMERKKLVAVVQEAIHSHLKAKGAFNLEVRSRPGSDDAARKGSASDPQRRHS